MKRSPKACACFVRTNGSMIAAEDGRRLRWWSATLGVEHKVRVQDFEQWLEGHPRSPAEMNLKNRLREIIERSNG
jgi:hypothetical protein